jgi:pilus assembly protein CpaF
MAFLVFGDRTRTNLDRLEDGGEFVIGSSFDCDIMSPENGVASHHCLLARHGGDYILSPCSRKNTFSVNGEEKSAETPLAHGDVFTFGDEKVEFYLKEPDEGSAEERKDAVKLKIHRLLLERINLKKVRSSDSGLRQKAREVIRALVDEFEADLQGVCDKRELEREVLNEALGLGVIDEFLEDPDITEIMVKNAKNIYIEKKGKLQLSSKKFLNEEQLIGVIERIVAPLGRRIDESSPIVDARLKDGSRVNAVIPPIALDGAALTIRKFSKTPFKIPDLIRFGSMTEEIAALIGLAVKHRQNVIISGGTGSGKTTLLNVSSSFIPEDERVVTVEDSAELQLPQDHVIRLESRPPNIEGKGRIGIRDLVINCLRMRPDRIVVGECRGGEALDMLQAMNTGHDGSLTTVHANGPRDAIARLETLVLMAGMELPARAIREQISMAVDIIVQQARLADGSRKITHVTEITGIREMEIQLEDIFVFKQTGIDDDGKIIGHFEATGYVPRFIRDLQSRGIEVPLHIFEKNDEREKNP